MHLDVRNQPDARFIPETETRINLFSFALYQNMKQQKSNRKKKKKKKSGLTSLTFKNAALKD